MSNYFETHAVSSPGIHLDNLSTEEGTKVYSVSMERQPSPFKDLISLFLMSSLIARIEPDIVHTHTPKAGLIGLMASWMVGIPVRLHTVAGIPWVESVGIRRKLLRTTEKLTYFFATHVYSNSFELRKFILKNELLPVDKISVVANGSSNGIDTSWFRLSDEIESASCKLKKQWAIDGFKVIVFVGRLVKDKGIEELLHSFIGLKKKGYRVKLVLVGPYEENRDPLTDWARDQINTDSDIICTGFVEDVRPYLAASDFLAFPSYREGFPNVPMQAGAMGLPSIVSDINGCNEIIKNEVNGLIIPPKNIDALSNAIERLLTDRNLYDRLSRNARPMIKNRFEQSLVWDALLLDYHKHLKKAGINV